MDPAHTLLYQGAYGEPENDNHAIQVAGLMIGNDDIYIGVAPMAQLHTLQMDYTEQDFTIVLGINRLATIQSGQVQSINMSFGIPQGEFDPNDGNSHLTKFIDWSARRHDVLYVVAWGNLDSPDFRKPGDNYNGITVGASETVDFDTAQYSTAVNAAVGDAVGERTSIDILAPGAYVRSLGRNNSTTPEGLFGTSFATAFTTGASALLQQRARDQLNLGNPDFVSGSRHEVMKAVILNSADKLENVHGSRRTILNGPGGTDWTQSPAYSLQFQSLDERMGAGMLNARRAMQQFAPGESDPGDVPLIGWDYDVVGGAGSVTQYYFDEPLTGGKYVAATLVWDRRNEHTGGNTYNYGDQFFFSTIETSMNNLDLYLTPADADPDDILVRITASRTFEDNVEHIFFNNFPTGDYKLVVKNNTVGGIGDSQNYALAWWFGSDAPPTGPLGDYNKNGSVGPEDYDVWAEDFGTTLPDADGNGDSTVNAADYIVWRKFADAAGSGGSPVPEPSGVGFAFVIGILTFCKRQRRYS